MRSATGLLTLLLLSSPAPSFADTPPSNSLAATTVEWISLSPESQALWIEGSAPDGLVSLEMKVADDTVVVASRETASFEGQFSSLLRAGRLPDANYTVEISSGHDILRIPISRGSESQRATYAQVEIAFYGDAFEQAVDLTRELHRVREEHGAARDHATWDGWTREWERRRSALRASLDEFRASRTVLARARDHYQLVASLCFAQTLHALYAAELGYGGEEPGAEEAREWSTALEEQFEVFRVRRTPRKAGDIEAWVAGLGSEDCEVRERSTRSLALAGEDARQALEGATRSDDPEVAGRAAQLLEKLAR